jgi:CRP/FNR family transcriptional regulator, anaerobic regulatory protein
VANTSRAVEVTSRVVTPCNRCPLRAMKTFRKFTPEELRFVEQLKVGEARLTTGQTVLSEGEQSNHLYTVLSGWLFKYKLLEDGRRQIINFAVPGDLLGLQSAVFGKMTHSVEAMGDVTLCVFPKAQIWPLYERHHGLGFDVTWLAAQEKAILAEFLVSAGQRTATERIAFLLLVLYRRARNVGLVRKGSIEFPITQEHFADTIGFSLVHTNKRIARLKRSGAFTWHGSTFTMIDEDALAELAGRPEAIAGPRPFL